jgi:hypothetical protein
VRKRLILGLVPVLLAGVATFASPFTAMAATGVVEKGTTTYTVNAAKQEIDVRVVLSITENTPSNASYYYFVDTTYNWVEIQAVGIRATSNAGAVKFSVFKTDKYYRELKIVFPRALYHQTRVVTVTYTIPAKPGAAGGYRAGKAYAELCAMGNGIDSGSVNVVVPDDFDVTFFSGTDLTQSSDAKGLKTFSSGTVSQPDQFWSCLEAEDPAHLTSKKVTAGDQTFNVQAWPEDAGWATTVAKDVANYSAKLEALTGLSMPGGTIAIQEAGDSQMGEYVGSYSPTTKTAAIVEGTDQATIAHELSHIWFNKAMFADIWTNEGLAGYSEKVAGDGNYKICTDPGDAPGGATLAAWKFLDVNSTADDQSIVDWQYAASCFLITKLAAAVGPTNFKTIIVAASNGEIAYAGAAPIEKSPLSTPVTAKAFLDLIDERGMVPSGVKDLDQVQKLFSQYGIISGSQLTERSAARLTYHTLADAAGKWALPYAVRSPMASWDFTTAGRAMDVANQILVLRDQVQKTASGFNLDGTDVQKQFQNARTQADLDKVLTLARAEADAASKIVEATDLNNGSHSFFQTVGLIGSDPASMIAQATDALKAGKPDEASSAAQNAIDTINSAGDQGMIRFAVLLALLLGLVALVFYTTGRRRRKGALAMAAGGMFVTPFPPTATDTSAWYGAPGAPGGAAAPPPPPPATSVGFVPPPPPAPPAWAPVAPPAWPPVTPPAPPAWPPVTPPAPPAAPPAEPSRADAPPPTDPKAW